MDMQAQAAENLKRRNQILFAKDSPYMRSLQAAVEAQPRRVQVLWALDMAQDAAMRLSELLPNESAPRAALALTQSWAAGQVKMPVAKRAILDCHAVAKRIQNAEAIALCHAVGQACSVVHTVGHTCGFPLYDLTAVVRRHGLADGMPQVEARKAWYLERLAFWQAHAQDEGREWAAFLK